ncbi:MAG: glycine oxidase ThiO [Thaumarchaeota archaeon]|nr:glycine oxidase ThiO [Nitrososphaerota archaeon]
MISIVGGGIIGLSIGWYLRRKGAEVTIFEEDVCGRRASWATAGMIAAHIGRSPKAADVSEMALSILGAQREGQELWKTFSKELEQASGVDIGYRATGSLRVAFSRDEMTRLESDYELQRGLGLQMELLTAKETLEMEPEVSKTLLAAILSPTVAQVDPRETMKGLREAYLRAGGRLYEHTRVESILVENNQTRGICFGGEVFNADQVVLAAGAWSEKIGGIPEADRPPVTPAKGQMMALRMDPNHPLTRIVSAKGGYSIPRAGRLIIGSTMEPGEFDASNTVGGVMNLLQRESEVIPSVQSLPIDEMWAGVRPKSPDGAPILGPTGVEGLVIATGHGHIGVVLAPVTARYIVQFLTGGRVADAIRPFSIDRFK